MNRIKELRKKRGWTLQHLSKLTNIAPNTLNQYELEKREPSFDILVSLSNIFGVGAEYLMGVEEKTKPKGFKIPVLGSIPAGIPIEAIEDVVDYEEINEEMARSGTYFGLKVKGDSMIPTISSGDVIIVRQQDDANSGQICVVMINGYDATLKEIKKESTGLWVLPHNPNSGFKPTFYTNKEVEELPVRILGVAVEIRRSL